MQPGGTAGFFGRARELDELARLLENVGRGTLRFGFVVGEAGIGKTAVASAVADAASERGFAVFRGAARELERDRPFGAVSDALGLELGSDDPDRGRLAELLLGPVEPAERATYAALPELRYRIVHEILELIEREAIARPVLLVLEDLHWGDPGTVLTLHQLLHQQERMSLGVLATLRPVPAAPDLDVVVETAESAGGGVIRLGPLDEEAVRLLVERMTGADAGPTLMRQVARAGGNPLFVHELVSSLLEEKAIRIEDGIADVEATSLAPPLRLTILRRLSFLPPPTLEALRMASILGSSFSLADLATITGQSIGQCAAALDQALRAGVLVDAGIRLAFRHDLVHEAVYQDISEPVRAGLHLQVARALAAAQAPAGQVAAHFAIAAQPGDVEAVTWLRRAASEAASKMPAVALALIERATRLLTPLQDGLRNELEVELSKALLWSGRLGEAAQMSQRLLSRGLDPAALEGIWHALGRALVYQGRVNESAAVVERALVLPELPPQDRAQLLADLSMRKPLQGDLEAAERTATEALRLCEERPDVLAASTANSALSLIAAYQGRFGEGVSHASRALEISSGDSREPVALLQPRFFLGLALVEADRLREGADEFLATTQLAEAMGTAWAIPLSHVALSLARFLVGDWDDAVADATSGLTIAEELGMQNWLLIAYSVLAQIAVHRGDLSSATAMTDRGSALIDAVGPAQLGFDRFLLSRALVAEAGGDAGRALKELAGAWSLHEQLGHVGRQREVGPELVRLALRCGDDELARKAAEMMSEAFADSPTPSARAAAALCRGLVTGESESLVHAAEAHRLSTRALDFAVASEEAGIALVRAGHLDQGRARAEEALSVFERLGCARDVAREEGRLRNLGIRRGRRGSRGRPRAGWEALTDTERQVAVLAAQGLTNPEIGTRLYVSRRTVGTHISHILAKLGITSRVELATHVAQRQDQADVASESVR